MNLNGIRNRFTFALPPSHSLFIQLLSVRTNEKKSLAKCYPFRTSARERMRTNRGKKSRRGEWNHLTSLHFFVVYLLIIKMLWYLFTCCYR